MRLFKIDTKKAHVYMRIVKVIAGIFLFMIIVISLDEFFDNYDLHFQSPVIVQTPIFVTGRKIIEPVPKVTESPETSLEDQILQDSLNQYSSAEDFYEKGATTSEAWIGKVSFYSHDGCIGCGPNQITASGQPFNEKDMTLAFNHLPMLTKVKVTNLDTGLWEHATVNDTGGFGKYNRIADLSKGLYEAIGAKTDLSNIKIEAI